METTTTTSPTPVADDPVTNKGVKRPHDDTTTTTDDTPRFELLGGFGEHRRAVSSVAWAPPSLTKNRSSTALVASASADGSAKVWDLAQESVLETPGERCMTPYNCFVGHMRGINEICWNPLSPLVATASDDKTARIWDAVTSDVLVELRGHTSFVFSIDQHQQSSLLVTGSFDETVKLWDIRTGDCVATVPAHSDPVTSVRFNRDGTLVCSASHDGLMRLWDVATGECLKTWYAAGNPPVSAVTYAPNGKYVLASTLDNCLRLWPVRNRQSAACLKTYSHKTRHVNSKYSIVADFTSDGSSVLTGNETGKALLYDLQTTEILQVLPHGKEPVLAVSAHRSRPLLCTGGMDKHVKFWALGSEKGTGC